MSRLLTTSSHSMERVSIRKALFTDLDDLVNLLQLLFSIETDFTGDPDSQGRDLQMLLEHADTIIMVAEVENKVIGMCTGQILISAAEGGLSLLVEDVVVAISWQLKGGGSQLLTGLEKWAATKNVSRFQLLADSTNNAGLTFYSKQDWKPTQLICLRKTIHIPQE